MQIGSDRLNQEQSQRKSRGRTVNLVSIGSASAVGSAAVNA